ncbi:MAG: hypothetical protein H7A09_03395 [Oceanospirillaceae bacterium]|nr:hypothetical protein [Oceanospirillaceae bacterium]MCP5335661.1 hypothetical protein [Oceanospirillaceae bacterium]MCP5350316.1 hypothetical protein [Oceanospirillaceae bacterium]
MRIGILSVLCSLALPCFADPAELDIPPPAPTSKGVSHVELIVGIREIKSAKAAEYDLSPGVLAMGLSFHTGVAGLQFGIGATRLVFNDKKYDAPNPDPYSGEARVRTEGISLFAEAGYDLDLSPLHIAFYRGSEGVIASREVECDNCDYEAFDFKAGAYWRAVINLYNGRNFNWQISRRVYDNADFRDVTEIGITAYY